MSNIKKAANADQSIKRPHKKTFEPSQNNHSTVWEAIEAFQNVLQDNGLGRPDIKPDAGLQRFKLDSDKGNAKSGWYTFHTTGDIYAAGYGNWKTGLNETWHYKKGNKPLSDKERRELAKVYEQAKEKRFAEIEKQYASARRVANSIWNSASPAPENHSYLVRKHIQSAARYLRQDTKGNLVVPLYNSKRLVSIQYINQHGGKFFAKGGQLKGAYFLFGDIKKPFDTVYICEGISTGWTIHSLTGHTPTFCAMNAGNLKNVALGVCKRWPDVSITLCADNDVRNNKTMPNTGVEEAKKAALAVNGRVSIPSLPDGSKCDFNDLYVLAIETQNKNKKGVKA